MTSNFASTCIGTGSDDPLYEDFAGAVLAAAGGVSAITVPAAMRRQLLAEQAGLAATSMRRRHAQHGPGKQRRAAVTVNGLPAVSQQGWQGRGATGMTIRQDDRVSKCLSRRVSREQLEPWPLCQMDFQTIDTQSLVDEQVRSSRQLMVAGNLGGDGDTAVGQAFATWMGAICHCSPTDRVTVAAAVLESTCCNANPTGSVALPAGAMARLNQLLVAVYGPGYNATWLNPTANVSAVLAWNMELQASIIDSSPLVCHGPLRVRLAYRRRDRMTDVVLGLGTAVTVCAVPTHGGACLLLAAKHAVVMDAGPVDIIR